MKTKRILLGAAVAAVFAAAPAMAQAPHLGGHAGYNFDRENGLAGIQLTVPITQAVAFYPSVDFHFGGGSRTDFNLDLKFTNPGQSAMWYAGGGLGLLRTTAGGVSNTDAGGNLFAGLETTAGMIHPYVEVRGLINRQSSVQLQGGVNIALRGNR